MSDSNPLPLRVLFCCGVSQNFFDLPREKIGEVWQAYGAMLAAVEAMPGVRVLGVMDDDRLVVGRPTARRGPSTSWPTSPTSTRRSPCATCIARRRYNLWRYGKIEARVGRALTVPPAAKPAA